ncbi:MULTISPECIES: MarR family winged helix-turn-helix transcriptional regulator [Streptomyces]|uniref:Transcriptional regulator n=1 Tax=Streptomyces alboflavus TaxID=67267 RepID=A0A1Z1W8N2_9ACTN|nr:MarR family transcriptional regulator [Streptomyces alboflavus]ARX82801.1 transcriptional regulator [Streptomyces alboflavus]
MPKSRTPQEPSDPEPSDPERADVVARLSAAGRANSAVTVMFHSAVAARQGLNATESKTLDLLIRKGPLTAKDLAAETGLAPASVTGLVDRLEAKGFVRRVKHPTDKRRVLVEFRAEKMAGLTEVFADWGREVEEFCEEFTTAELETVIRFLDGVADRQRRAAARLTE